MIREIFMFQGYVWWYLIFSLSLRHVSPHGHTPTGSIMSAMSWEERLWNLPDMSFHFFFQIYFTVLEILGFFFFFFLSIQRAAF